MWVWLHMRVPSFCRDIKEPTSQDRLEQTFETFRRREKDNVARGPSVETSRVRWVPKDRNGIKDHICLRQLNGEGLQT